MIMMSFVIVVVTFGPLRTIQTFIVHLGPVRLLVAVLDFSGLEATKMPLRNNAGLVLMSVVAQLHLACLRVLAANSNNRTEPMVSYRLVVLNHCA